MISGIYKIENTKNNKVYIGSSKNIDNRFNQHQRLLELNKHHSIKLQASYNKCKDKSVFVYNIVELVDDMSKLKDREEYWINKYDAYNNGYNCTSKPDNPKYARKNINKQKRKEKSELMYEEFWKVYNSFSENRFRVSDTFLNKIKDKHYSFVGLNKVVVAMKWFKNTYKSDEYFATFRYNGNAIPYINIYNFNDNKKSLFEYKIIKKNVILVNDFTTASNIKL